MKFQVQSSATAWYDGTTVTWRSGGITIHHDGMSKTFGAKGTSDGPNWMTDPGLYVIELISVKSSRMLGQLEALKVMSWFLNGPWSNYNGEWSVDLDLYAPDLMEALLVWPIRITGENTETVDAMDGDEDEGEGDSEAPNDDEDNDYAIASMYDHDLDDDDDSSDDLGEDGV